jgi:hypothetical protein
MITIDLSKFDWCLPATMPPRGYGYVGTVDFDGVKAAVALSPDGEFCAVRCGFVWALPRAETKAAYDSARRYARRAAYWKPRA